MNFSLNDGTAFALTLLGYQFPHLATEPYDSNWLMIRIDATTALGSWSATDPCLLTYEVAQLADWIDAIAAGTVQETTCSFIEPCLLFRLVETPTGAQELRIFVELELRPPWAPANIAEREDLWLAFPCTAIDLPTAAIMLRQQLLRYLQRAMR